MIGIGGQYIFKFSIGNKEDFIDPHSFKYFLITEESGNALPTWEINFTTTDSKLLAVFNEGNDFKISFGRTLESLKEAPLLITKRLINRIGSEIISVTAFGIYSAMSYIANPIKFISDKKSGVAVLSNRAKKYFKIDSNISSSSDSQYWIQPNITDKAFIDHLWLHSYLPDSFLGTAICYDGTFRIRDIKKAVQEDFKFRFTNRIEDEKKDIEYTGDYLLKSETGFINCWMGYGRKKLIHTFEDDSQSIHSESIKPLIALTKKLNRRRGIENKVTLTGVHNENTHSNYWPAALRNTMGLTVFSSEKNTLSFSNRLEEIHPLDIVLFQDEDNVEKRHSMEYQSGLYIVGAVGVSISNNDLITTVDLYRESFNAIEGELQ